MTARQTFANVNEWLFRSAAMREARGVLVAGGEARGEAVHQTRLLVEVGRRVAEPVETLPAGSRPAVLLGLYREAVTWALLAGRPEGSGGRQDLATLWGTEPPERLLAAAKDPAALEAVRTALIETASAPLAATEEQAQAARSFAEALLSELEAPSRRVDRVVAQRWTRLLVAGAVLIAATVGLRKLTLGPNLAEGRPFHPSSSWAGCASDPPCKALLFHTDNQNNPWAEVDLGAPKRIHRVEITNRADCCGERAVPLIVELSTDHAGWTEVARRDAEFSTWTATFRSQAARYVRLRVPRQTTFHLEEVAVR